MFVLLTRLTGPGLTSGESERRRNEGALPEGTGMFLADAVGLLMNLKRVKEECGAMCFAHHDAREVHLDDESPVRDLIACRAVEGECEVLARYHRIRQDLDVVHRQTCSATSAIRPGTWGGGIRTRVGNLAILHRYRSRHEHVKEEQEN